MMISPLSSVEEHVLQHVGQPGAQPFALVNAAGHAPRLGRHDRRAVIFAHDDNQPIVERGNFHARRDGWEGLVG